MHFYVYRRRVSDSARALVEALDGTRLKLWPSHWREGPVLVCWGESPPINAPVPTFVLNAAPVGNKLTDAAKLKAAGVATIDYAEAPPSTDEGLFAAIKPAYEQCEEFLNVKPSRLAPYQAALDEFLVALTQLKKELRKPQPQDEWLPRKRNHVGGNDLLSPPSQPDYWVKKENITVEYRVHSFCGRSIRAGVKVPRDLFPLYHQWIRSWDAGWRIVYDGVSVRQKHRNLAHKAVAALGLDFGAVDIAERPDGSIFVLEVNRAPGIEAGTIDAYAEAIRKWAVAKKEHNNGEDNQ